MMDSLFSFIEYYLPIFIPIFLVILSILAGVLTGRIALKVPSLLKTHNDLVIGLFSFCIWGLIAKQQTGRISLNADYEISFIRIVLLLFVDFFYLLIAFILLKYPWKDSERFPKWPASRQEKIFNGALLLFTIFLVFIPLSLKAKTVKGNQETPTAAIFRVVVPYFDESLEKNMGVARWNLRLLCEVEEVQATSESEAIGAVLKNFEDSKRDVQIISTKGAAASKVSVIKDKITVQRK
jgi:hypothetical protein